ncbi:MAG TPA: NrfD/PsrC family molybdoenzyme membrane anchor subunit [Bryobacteraceae bacterium]|jgi:molybdopterin-containing oxidoreductase family membrane subunit|nr:NrfD/PsrC family molybdoenzyme membrane anchor subunit [Bryobacteraceae bacterium]
MKPTEESENPPVIAPGHNYRTVTSKIADVVLAWPLTLGWLGAFSIVFLGTMMLFLALTYLVVKGTGIWGINIPVAWGFAIINFVWWIGIGHAGTLISAILLLLKQDWRTSINRFAEAMTLFAVLCAGLFPLFHTGRPWLAYWMFPYPSTMDMWPQPRSPLIWDVFAVSTYLTVSFLFWYVGLIPDLAVLRDRARRRWQQIAYGMLAMGWRGSARHWFRYEMAYLLLAGLATPLVVSVHTVVSFDFAVSQVPGWHTTIFPPYFVAGAIHSGFAMVMTLAIPTRAVYGLKDFITMRHLQNMAKMMIGTSWIVAYGYIMEIFMGWYSGSPPEEYMILNRFTGPYAPLYWSLWVTNIFAAQLFWSKSIRSNTIWLFFLSLVINLGMWLERFVIVVTSLHRDYLPSSWEMYYPTFWDWATFFGTISLFLTLMFLFLRVLPAISISEMNAMVPPPPVPRPSPKETLVSGD